MKRTIVMIMIILAVVSMGLAAQPLAEKQYIAIQDQILSLEEARKAYDALDEAIVREREAAGKSLSRAIETQDRVAYQSARLALRKLSSYRMSRQQSDALLAEILALDEPERSQQALWLSQKSPYWRPTLTLDFSDEGEGYRYSYRQQITVSANSEVTLPSASQIRFSTKYLGILVGWGLTPDEVTYQAGQTIAMPYTDQTLYAIYQEGVRFVDQRSGIDLTITEGDVTVPTPESSDPSALFFGWYDRTTRSLITEESPYTGEGKGGFFEALWKQLSIDDIALLYYRSDNAPKNTQLAVGFSYANGGNLELRGLRATLTADSEYVTLLRDTLALGRLAAGYTGTNNSRWAT
ncbi:MAG: hypothetical protein M0Q37_10525, partial [Sphaerochaeta sp.]|nr:hypothetical protein [Sphaerochaeta sp.]